MNKTTKTWKEKRNETRAASDLLAGCGRPWMGHKLVINQLTDEAYCNSYFESTCIKLNTVTLPTASGNTNPWHPDSEEGKEDKSIYLPLWRVRACPM